MKESTCFETLPSSKVESNDGSDVSSTKATWGSSVDPDVAGGTEEQGVCFASQNQTD